jgi:glycosyltransferase involved in cell wall biosynthesis
MKISYFSTYFPYKNKSFNEKYTVGGGGVVIEALAGVLAQKGHKISIFTTSVNSKTTIERCANIRIHRYGTNFRVASGRFSFGLLKNSVKYPADLVHAHVTVPMGDIAGLRYAKKKKIPFVVTHHGDLQENMGGFARRMSVYFYNKFLLDKILSHADVIISPSEYYIEESGFLGKYRDKIVVIPNGVNVKEFDIDYSKEECRKKLGLPIDDEIILFLGTLGPHKGPDILLKAMPKILKNIPDAKLVFVGGGVMRDELEKRLKKLGVEKNVKFAGFIGDTFKKALYYRAADIFVLPSMIEVFPVVLLEASASGLPMVVSDLITFKCIIEKGYNGIITKKGHENNLADAIIYLLENEDVRGKMGKNGKKKVKDYSWERIAEMTEKVYEGLI